MKRFYLLLLMLALCLVLAACGANGDAGSESADAPESSSEVIEPEEPEEPEEAEPEETTEPEETESKGNSASIATDVGLETVSDQNDIRGGTNMDDAILLPLETKLYGTVQDGRISWFAFTTDSTENATYAFTTINKTLGTCTLSSSIYDKYGNQLNDWRQADWTGKADTYQTDALEPNTTYYLDVEACGRAQDTIHYMLRIRNMTAQANGYRTANNANEAVGNTAALEGNITPATNMDDAGYIPLGVTISGTVTDGLISWFAFTTDDTENATYAFTTVNKTVGTCDLSSVIFDEYGNQFNDWSQADQSGKAVTFQTNNLKPNTTYYLDLVAYGNRPDTIHYTLLITPPEKPASNTAAIATEEETLVFETPFELNETQVMFKAESADFIDPTAAQEALKPVAEIILAHLDHNILLAGTTATDGDQANRVQLSERRANAVKTMLVEKFGVPETQIQTIGLGYADDPFVRGQDRVPAGDVNGQFVESEGAKNRRVIVMDAESDIAKQILGQ